MKVTTGLATLHEKPNNSWHSLAITQIYNGKQYMGMNKARLMCDSQRKGYAKDISLGREKQNLP